MAVTIGIDPHKGSHTAVALDEHEAALGQLRVRSGPDQLATPFEWAKAWPERTWAVENASGLGYLLAQQLVGCRREGAGRPAQARLPGTPARQRRRQQERPQRRPLCRRGRAAGQTPVGGGKRGPQPRS